MTTRDSVSHETIQESAEGRASQEITREIRAELEARGLTEIPPEEMKVLFSRAYPQLPKADLEEMVTGYDSFTYAPLSEVEPGLSATEEVAAKDIVEKLSSLPDVEWDEHVDALTCLVGANWQFRVSEGLLSIPLYLYATFGHSCTDSIANALRDAQKIYEWRKESFGAPGGWSRIAWVCFLINAKVHSEKMLEVDARNGGQGCLVKWWPEFNLFHITDPPPTKVSVAAVTRKYLKKQRPFSLRRDIYGSDNPEARGLREQCKYSIRRSVWNAVSQPLQDRLGVPLVKEGQHKQGRVTLRYGSSFQPSSLKVEMDDAGNFSVKQLTFAWQTSLELALDLPDREVEVKLLSPIPPDPLYPGPRTVTLKHKFFGGQRDLVLKSPNLTPAISPQLTANGRLEVDNLLTPRFRFLSIDLDLFDPGGAFDSLSDLVESLFDSQVQTLASDAIRSMCDSATFKPDYASRLGRNAARGALKTTASFFTDVMPEVAKTLAGDASLSIIGLMAHLLSIGDDFSEWLSEQFRVPIGLENFTLTRAANVISECFEAEL